MKTLISIDPGLSSGVVVGTYSDTEPYKLTHASTRFGRLRSIESQREHDRPVITRGAHISPVKNRGAPVLHCRPKRC